MSERLHTRVRGLLSCLGTSLLIVAAAPASAVNLALSDAPLFVQESVPPMNMLVVGRDHKLYYEAYNDHSDLNGDNVLDVGYKPAINYYGYFDSYKCYSYDAANNRFDPSAVTTDKTCTNLWSGDWLNYITMTRIDALRKVLYGGSRFEDINGATTLARSHVPQDAHSWGKEYTSEAIDGYDLTKYTPIALPTAGTRHLFANTTLLNDANQLPRMRVLLNQTVRIWNWVSIERPVAGGQVVTGINGSGGEIRSNVTPTDYVTRVRVCVTGLLEANCQKYANGNFKPIGLLQEFGESNSMYFGLLTGSYAKNTSGGVLRRGVGSITDEVSLNSGRFRSFDGVIRTLERLRTTGFGGNYEYGCGSGNAGSPLNEGNCQMWGNPVAEMMYETVRYFAGKNAATSAFSITFGQGEESQLTGGGLPVASWDNPYSNRPVCTKPFETVVSDVNTSYDTNQLPGVDSNFGSFTGDVTGLNVSTLAQTIWDNEIGGTGNYFIGQVGATTDGAPTPKSVSSFGNIRGLSPEEPTKRGGYYSASVAYHALTNDLNPATGDQKLSTFSVALASPLPKIEIPVGTGTNRRTITLMPFAKTVGGAFGISETQGAFQPTNQIVDFYVDSLTETTGRFRVNFEDVEQGNDHDMDAIVVYDYVVNADNTVTINLTSEYAAGSAMHHLGFVISGTTADGIYLPVRDRDTAEGSDRDYFLDTPNTIGVALPLTYTGSFSPGTTGGASVLKDPLWYAAKWGGFEDANANKLPNGAEWDADSNGVPDNYFLVTNALTLSQQLRSAFEEIIARVSSASSASVNSGSVSSDTRIYQARFNSGSWTGQLLAYPVKTDGTLGTLSWDAATQVPLPNARKIITVNSDGTPVPFRWTDLDATRHAAIEPTYATDAALAAKRFAYMRGDRTNERAQGNPTGIFRERPTLLGDIVSSSPLWVGAPFFAYPDTLETKPYSEFRKNNASRREVVYAGANDGMLHAFDGKTGEELLAYLPSTSYRNLRSLSTLNYTHKFFVDGAPNMRDVYFNDNWRTVLVGGLNGGGQGVYALNITDPGDFDESKASSLAMWEFTDRDGPSTGISGDSDLGYTYSQPALVKLSTGRWAAIFGNGYNNTEADGSQSTTGNAVLYVVDAETGKLIRKIDTLKGTSADPLGQNRPNGLATPAAVDANGDRVADFIYAGDLFGNMWKFDIRNASPTNWKVAYGTTTAPEALFSALGSANAAAPNTVTLAQAITSRPEVVRGPKGVGMMVLFGTGKYLEVADKTVNVASPAIQTYYGIWDQNSGLDTDRVTTRTDLLEQKILYEGPVTFGTNTYRIRATSDLPLVAQRGWYIDLLSPNGYNGERQVSNTSVRGSRVIFTTLIPNSDPCSFGGTSWLMELEAIDGSRLNMAPFDLDGRPGFDGGDLATIVVGGQTIKVPVSGLQPDVGIAPESGFVYGEGATQEYIYSPGTTGEIGMTIGSTDPRARGRQSWRQVR